MTTLVSLVSPFLKCPPYCRVNCVIKHHPLLVALLNATDSEDLVISKGKLQDLDHVAKKYMETGWKLEDDIPEKVENFRYPLLHWASSMGRISATYWLLSKGVPSSLKSNDSEKETPLHRALLCLQETCPNTAAERFENLLLPLEECLVQQNAQGNTPLHLCAEMLVNEMPRTEFYADCFNRMIQYGLTSKGRVNVTRMVNIKNSDGDTVLHVLVTSGKQFACVKRVITLGADLFAFNKKGKTPMDIALNCGYIRTSKYLEQHMLEKKDSGKKESRGSGALKRTYTPNRANEERKQKQSKQDQSPAISVEIPGEDTEPHQDSEHSPSLSHDTGQSSRSHTPSSTNESWAEPSGSESKEGGAPLMSSTQSGLTVEEREDAIRGSTTSYKRMYLNTDRLLDKGRGPIRGMSTLNAPGADKKIIKFLTGCSNITRKIFRNSIEADREILFERSQHLQTMIDGIQKELVNSSEKQKGKVEGIQKLLDDLKSLQKEERTLDMGIKNMLLQLTQTSQATDGLKERLAHCTAALDVLASLAEDTGATEGQGAGQEESSASTSAMNESDEISPVSLLNPDGTIAKIVEIDPLDIASLKSDALVKGTESVMFQAVFENHNVSIREVKGDVSSGTVQRGDNAPGDPSVSVVEVHDSSQDLISSQDTTESSLENERTESSPDESSQECL